VLKKKGASGNADGAFTSFLTRPAEGSNAMPLEHIGKAEYRVAAEKIVAFSTLRPGKAK